MNNIYGVNLTEEDQLNISSINKRLEDDPEVKKCMNGDNTEENKKHYFKEQFEEMMLNYVNERFDFYKKINENPPMKELIFQEIYKNYNNQIIEQRSSIRAKIQG